MIIDKLWWLGTASRTARSHEARAAAAKSAQELLESEPQARNGDPADVLCDIAADHGVDIMVVGNKGMERRILGSVPNSVSHKAPCSVMIVKTA